MFPVILSSLFFFPELKINNTQITGRIVKSILFLALYLILDYLNIRLGFIDFRFNTHNLQLINQGAMQSFSAYSAIAIFFFIFAKRPVTRKRVSLIGILPFIPLGVNSAVLAIMVIASACLIEDMINSEIPFFAKIGLSLTLFGVFLIDPAFKHLYPVIINDILLYGISFVLIFIILNNDLIFDKKAAYNEGFKTLITLFFIGFVFYLKQDVDFNVTYFNIILVLNVLFFLIRVFFKNQYLPLGELFHFNTFIIIWLYIGEFNPVFISIYTVLSIILPLINYETKVTFNSSNIVKQLENYPSLIFTSIILNLVTMFFIINLLATYTTVGAILYAFCFWFFLKIIFKLLIINVSRNNTKKVTYYIVVQTWGVMLIAGVMYYV